MTDPLSALGAAASIVQLVQVSAELSVKFYTISKQIKNAPKVFEEISNEIASTATILQLLASELEDQSRLQLHKPAAVQKTKQLMSDCTAIYETLRKRITPDVDENASDRAKSRAQWKKRLKMPYMADEFTELRNKLIGVKTWLNMMLSTLSLGVQAKGFSGSQEAKELLLEQRQMLELLMQETRLLRGGADQRTPSHLKPDLQQASETNDKGIRNPFTQSVNASPTSLATSLTTLVNTNTLGSNVGKPVTNDPTSTTDAEGSEKGQVAVEKDDCSAPRRPGTLPDEMSFYAREIREQARLITDLVDKIDQRSYAISRRTRTSMHEQTLDVHLQQWAALAQKHGYKYFIPMVEDFPDLCALAVAPKGRGQAERFAKAAAVSPPRQPEPATAESARRHRRILHDFEQASDTESFSTPLPSPPHSSKLDNPNLTTEQVSAFREIFDLIDKDMTGYTNCNNLLTIFRSLGENISESELDDYLNQLQLTDQDKLSFNDFLRLMQISIANVVDADSEGREAFMVFDKETSNIMSEEEIRAVMEDIDETPIYAENDERMNAFEREDEQTEYARISQAPQNEKHLAEKPARSLRPCLKTTCSSYVYPQKGVDHNEDKMEDIQATETEPEFMEQWDVSCERNIPVSSWCLAPLARLRDSGIENEEELVERDNERISKDVEDLLREYTMLTEEELKMLEAGA